MRDFLFPFLATALLAACSSNDAAPPRPDLEALQGTWLTVSLVNDGKVLVSEGDPAPAGPVTKLVYEGDHWGVVVGDETVASGVLRVDTSKTPHQIDILDESGMRNAASKLGIYELDGDRYRFCLAPADKPRPTGFASPEGSGISLGVCRREMP